VGLRAADLATLCDGVVHGDADLALSGVADLDSAGASDISFITHARYLPALKRTAAGAVFTAALVADLRCVQIVCADPYLAMARAATALQPPYKLPSGIDPAAHIHPSARLATGVYVGPTAVIEAGAQLGPGCRIEAGAFVGTDAQLGADCLLHPGARLLRGCLLGDRVILHSGAVIGSDGFGFAVDGAGVRQKIPQLGIVRLGDDVEVGANTTIDRATFGATRINQGTKIDNLVQIGHNVQIGAHCVIVSQSGIAGSTCFEDYVIAGAQSGFVGHLRIAAHSVFGARAGVLSHVKQAGTYSGWPAVPHPLWRRNVAAQKKSAELLRRVQVLEAQVQSSPSATP
jgi:UDP-3-O-[3-hydroxymyristoyl] glucosamine N-acyltransferase